MFSGKYPNEKLYSALVFTRKTNIINDGFIYYQLILHQPARHVPAQLSSQANNLAQQEATLLFYTEV